MVVVTLPPTMPLDGATGERRRRRRSADDRTDGRRLRPPRRGRRRRESPPRWREHGSAIRPARCPAGGARVAGPAPNVSKAPVWAVIEFSADSPAGAPLIRELAPYARVRSPDRIPRRNGRPIGSDYRRQGRNPVPWRPPRHFRSRRPPLPDLTSSEYRRPTVAPRHSTVFRSRFDAQVLTTTAPCRRSYL